MNDLISREQAKKAFAKIAQPAEYKGVIRTVVPISEIDKLPAVDAVKVKHGEWKVVDCSYWEWRHDTAVPVFRKKYVCPECGRQTVIKENFCPKCGTKMDGGKHESSD